MNTESTQSESIASQQEREVLTGERFEFGRNWHAFLSVLNEQRIAIAQESLCKMLELETLAGKTFLDIGSGSGLFSLAARRLGAKVSSFDYDSSSVACTAELKRLYFPNDREWNIEQGSILEDVYVRSLGQFDIVYSWGVLHHTGNMWNALSNANIPVAENGKLFIAIYNDTGSQSTRWKWIKRLYCKMPKIFKSPFAILVVLPDEAKRFLRFTIGGKPFDYFRYWLNYQNDRGMNRWHDIIDWVGGYPYEVAGPSEIFEFYKGKGYRLTKLKCDRVGLGCNEFVFEKVD